MADHSTKSTATRDAGRTVRRGLTYTVYFGLVVAIVVVLNLISGLLFARFDLTDDKRYTLSDASERLVAEAERPIRAYAFVTSDLPTPYDAVQRQLSDLLAEYAASSGGKFEYVIVDPGQDEADQERAANFGIQPITIGEQSRDELSFREVYLGLALTYEAASGDRTDVIPQLFPGMNFEYEITRKLRKLVHDDDAPKIGFVINDGSFLDEIIDQATQSQNPMQPGADPEQIKSQLAQQLRDQLFDELYEIAFVDPTEAIDEDIEGLILLGPTEMLSDTAIENIDAFAMTGKGVAFFVSPFRMSEPPPELAMQGMQNFSMPEENETGLQPLLEHYGVRLNDDALIDRESAQVSVQMHTVAYFGEQPIQQPIPNMDPRLPLMTGINPDSLLVPNIPFLAFQPSNRQQPLPISSLTLTPDANAKAEEGSLLITPVASTSETAVRRDDALNISLEEASEPVEGEEPGPFDTIVTLEGTLESPHDNGTTDQGRILVASSGDFITNVFRQDDPLKNPRVLRGVPPAVAQSVVQYSETSILFFQNTADWLVSDHDLISIRGRGMPTIVELDRLDKSRKTFVQVANIAGIPLLFVVIGLIRWARRNRRRAELTEQFSGPDPRR